MATLISHRPASDRLASELEPGIFMLDHHFLGSAGVIASYLIVGDEGDGLTLVEAGPTSTIDTLLAGVRQSGHDPDDIARIVVTHIHLDHAGAAGALLQRLPRARLYVHPVGAPHLVDPAKLIASASRIYGEFMAPLWGEMLPVPEDRLVVLNDGEVMGSGASALRALDTPGHANHHLALQDEARGLIYTGDVAGLRLDGRRYVRPPTPPPEFDPDKWRASIVRLRGLSPRRLLLAHFGAYEDVAWHLDELLSRIWFWTGWVSAGLTRGEDVETTSESLRAMEDAVLAAVASGDPTLARRFEEAGNYRMSVDGIARWWRKRAATAP